MDNFKVQQQNCNSLDSSSISDTYGDLSPSGQSILTVRRLLHNLLTVRFSEEGSNRRILENETYEQFVKYVREAASKTVSKFKDFI